MCGIAGTFRTDPRDVPDQALLERAARAIAHRGPDDQGVQLGQGWGLASRRLAIIGLTSGHQPLANEDGTVWVAFNGEVYNHRALREQLQARGHTFATTTDTEVLVHAYEDRGPEMVKDLQGMFAFAIVDTRQATLFLARDRLGQKPLYYHVGADGNVAFASELGALRQFPGIPNQLNLQALSDYLSLMCIPAPDTIYEGVQKLPAGCHVLVSRTGRSNAPDPVCYWRPDYSTDASVPFDEAAERAGELLRNAVCKRLESEVPLGAFLSGGIDSSVIAAIMQQHSDQPIETFSIGFDIPRYDEREFAVAAARHIGTKHREKVLDPRDLELLRKLIRHHGEPFCDASMLPTALLSGFTREHVTVALSGDGGDELFGGYERYRVMALHRFVQRVPSRWRQRCCELILGCLPKGAEGRTRLATVTRLLNAFRKDDVDTYASFQRVFSDEAKQQLCSTGLSPSPYEREGGAWQDILSRGTAVEFVERFLELDLHVYLTADILCKVDIASMMASLEVRCPFLDHELVEFMAGLPRGMKVTLLDRKKLLKHIAASWIPSRLINRPKRGFGVPLSRWLREDLRQCVEELSDTAAWDAEGLFNPVFVRGLADEHLSGTCDHADQLWALLCLKFWLEDVYRES